MQTTESNLYTHLRHFCTPYPRFPSLIKNGSFLLEGSISSFFLVVVVCVFVVFLLLFGQQPSVFTPKVGKAVDVESV